MTLHMQHIGMHCVKGSVVGNSLLTESQAALTHASLARSRFWINGLGTSSFARTKPVVGRRGRVVRSQQALVILLS